ncbi:hypothetical protein GCM10010430_77620 [Kitasatospora cystarginea]|uniref:Uncharacterized protein n=1 Tax=Kitasatospora cystarginea TaxID=58350 RepID=A0ABN3F0D1_9ACTN
MPQGPEAASGAVGPVRDVGTALEPQALAYPENPFTALRPNDKIFTERTLVRRSFVEK